MQIPFARCAPWLGHPWKRTCPSAVWKPLRYRAHGKAINEEKTAARLVPYQVTIKRPYAYDLPPTPKGDMESVSEAQNTWELTSALQSLLIWGSEACRSHFRELVPREVLFNKKLYSLLILYIYTVHEIYRKCVCVYNIHMERVYLYIDTIYV